MTFWKHLGAAPHRMLFLIGSLQAIFAMLFWLAVLEWSGLPELAWPGPAAHAWTMLYGLFPAFIFGFLFTALPNWVNGPAIPRRDYLATALSFAIGGLLFYAGMLVPGLDMLALGLQLAGWSVGLLALLRSLRSAPPDDNRQPWAVWLATLLGLLGMGSFLAWRVTGIDILLTLGEQLGLWGCLTPLFLAVCHRMIPYFTSRIVSNYVLIRPYSALWIMFAACLGHALLTTLGDSQWTWATDLTLAGIAFWFSARWGLLRGLTVRLLGMLHIAFLWAGLAFLLFGISSLMQLLNIGDLGLAPLHALAIGFFSSMLIGMAARVSLGHSGRKLECDVTTWRLFLAIQLAAVARMLPDLFPGWIDNRVVSLAGAMWLLTFVLWAIRYAPIYWRPRADGKPG
jgi:uncharacterized protein involved in response to NO